MASQVNFWVQVEDSSGNVQFKKDLDPSSEITFTKDGGAFSPGTATQNNGDGSYTFYITESGKYTILINGNAQDEFTDVYIAAEDNLSEQNLAASPTKGQVKLNGSDKLEIEDAATMLLESDIVDSLVSSSTTDALSANQGSVINTALGTKVNTSAIVNDLTTGGTAVPLSAQQGVVLNTAITLNFARGVYISDSYTISQNFERLDRALFEVAKDNITTYRQIHGEPKQATTAANNSITATAYDRYSNTSGTAQYKAKGMFQKRANDTKILLHAMCELSSGSMADADLRLSLGSTLGVTEYTTSVTYQGGGEFQYDIEVDISNITDDEFLQWGVGCYIGTPAGGTMYVGNIQVEVRTN